VTLKRSIPLNLAVLALNGWLVWANVGTWSADTDPDQGLPAIDAAQSAGSAKAESDQRRSRVARKDYQVVQAKNPFHPERRKIDAAPDPDEARQAREASDYTLLGTVVLENNERLAYLMKKGEDASRRYYLSEKIDGYLIASIESTEVRLRKPTEELIVKCFTGESKPASRSKSARLNRNSSAKSRRDYLRERRLRKARERARGQDEDE